ncbi:MAG: ATP phosphoribosyltransferase regulatory subunit [Chloroflexaceae bacterium]|nr:ATP phosphoribosyltransferase regulatory subunit [Chloroflexaceae bacterium]
MSNTIEAVRGMRDVLPPDQRDLLRVRTLLEATLARHGYTPIDLPIIESRDLYARKLGEELAGKVYEFDFGERALALRPEWTASVLRAYVNAMQDQPLPLRLSYSGPVFRYERPQRLTYRQFTQVGVELVGGPTPRADAEIIALACAGLDAAGLHGYQVVLGHIGLVRELLAQLGLPERTQGLLAWNMERLRTHGIESVRARLHEPADQLPFDPALLEGLDDDQAAALLLRLLESIRVDLAFGTRPPEAIVGRLLRKLRRDHQQPNLERALELLHRLVQLRGHPDETLPHVAQLLAEADVVTSALEEIRAILRLLASHQLEAEQVVLDFGLGRGLSYYTGIIFEIYDQQQLQLCGGGRYDDLVTTLGGRQPVPAVGFAYGLERIVVASATPAADNRDVLVIPIAEADYDYGLLVARRLRERGFVVAVDVRGRNLASNLRDAARRNTAYVAIVGAEERGSNSLVWRNLRTREERRVSLDEIAEKFSG